MQEKRYYSEINIMRGIAVLLVIVGHSFEETTEPTILGFIRSFIYTFHMPAFFFISGFLAKKNYSNWKEKWNQMKKKTIRFLVPYFFLTGISIGLKILFSQYARDPLNDSTLFFDIILCRKNPNGELWFLYTLYFITMVHIIASGISKKILIVIAFICNLWNVFVFHNENWIIGFVLTYLWYFYLGDFVKEYYTVIKEKIERMVEVYCCFYGLILILIAFLNIYYFYNIWISYIIAVAGIFLLLMISIKLTKSKNRFYFLLQILGDYGMDNYMVGYYVQQSVWMLFARIAHLDYSIYAWLMCVSGIVLPTIISKYTIRKSRILSFLILGTVK